jgi:hypothetical protein
MYPGLGKSFLGFLLSTVALTPLARAEQIATVASVNPAAKGTPPGGASQSLALGSGVVFKERIETSAEGSAQLAFTDRSTLNVGRNSNLVIDQFVYDPNAGTGAMSVTLGKGILRFVGGQVSHTSGATITTPVAVMGVRGGVATVGYLGRGGTDQDCAGGIFINHFGTTTLHNHVSQVTIRRPGYGVCITSQDEPIGKPFLIPAALLQRFMEQLTSGSGEHGGVVDLPTDQMASRNGFQTPRLDPPGSPPGSNPLDILSIIQLANGTAQGSAQDNQISD